MLDEILTVTEVAKYLRVSRVTVWRWCNQGEIPAFKAGRAWRIHRAVLEQMMRTSGANGEASNEPGPARQQDETSKPG